MKRRYKSKPRRRTPRRRSYRRKYNKVARIVRSQPSLKHFLRVPVRLRWTMELQPGELQYDIRIHRFAESAAVGALAYN